jgi:hypothetical protein
MKAILGVLALSFSVPVFAQSDGEPLDVVSMSDAELRERVVAAAPTKLFDDPAE